LIWYLVMSSSYSQRIENMFPCNSLQRGFAIYENNAPLRQRSR
jgi:hypothetical protein